MNARNLLIVTGAVSPIALALTPAGLFVFLAAVTGFASAVVAFQQTQPAPATAALEADATD